MSFAMTTNPAIRNDVNGDTPVMPSAAAISRQRTPTPHSSIQGKSTQPQHYLTSNLFSVFSLFIRCSLRRSPPWGCDLIYRHPAQSVCASIPTTA